MHVRLPLAEHIRLAAPLPWDVLDDKGILLLRKGTVITDPRRLHALIERGVYVDEMAYARHSRSRASGTDDGSGAARARGNSTSFLRKPKSTHQADDPFPLWDDISRRLAALLWTEEREPQFNERLLQLSADLQALAERDADAALFAMTRLERADYASAHSLQVAVASLVYAGRHDWSAAERASLVNAALTMNLAMLDLQRALCLQSEPPSAEQRQQIRIHPVRACERLQAHGVSDPLWLRAVLEHHETGDGSGYPRGLTEISPLAQTLRVADHYWALLSHRSGRQAILPNQAAKSIYLYTPPKLQDVVAGLVKTLGVYPPGTFVALANGEVAVVTGRGEHASKPRVSTVVGASGTKLTDPIPRDTDLPEYAVSHAVAEAKVAVHIAPGRLFGY